VGDKVFVGESEREDYLEDLGINGKMILEWILEKKCEFIWFKIRISSCGLL
jgi:hypothetical protein